MNSFYMLSQTQTTKICFGTNVTHITFLAFMETSYMQFEFMGVFKGFSTLVTNMPLFLLMSKSNMLS